MMIAGEQRDRNQALYQKGVDKLKFEEKLKIFVITWNMARKKLVVKPE